MRPLSKLQKSLSRPTLITIGKGFYSGLTWITKILSMIKFIIIIFTKKNQSLQCNACLVLNDAITVTSNDKNYGYQQNI